MFSPTGPNAAPPMRPSLPCASMARLLPWWANATTRPASRAVDAQRQPRFFAFELLVYFAALRKRLTPNDTIDASPVDIKEVASGEF
jgi:hypothetical protein